MNLLDYSPLLESTPSLFFWMNIISAFILIFAMIMLIRPVIILPIVLLLVSVGIVSVFISQQALRSYDIHVQTAIYEHYGIEVPIEVATRINSRRQLTRPRELIVLESGCRLYFTRRNHQVELYIRVQERIPLT